MARVYRPLTLALLQRLHETGEVSSQGAVLPDGDDEESEYAALQEAADASAAMLEGPGRRVVAVAEVADLRGPISLSHVVAVHVDDGDVDPGDPSYDEAPELGWWATQEIGELLRGG